MEGGTGAAAFSSGTAAMMGVFQSLPKGSHVIVPSDVYHGTARFLRGILAPLGLEITFVDMARPTQIEQATRPNTKLIWVETPSNPLLRITDIAQISGVAHKIGALCVCDNTGLRPSCIAPSSLGLT